MSTIQQLCPSCNRLLELPANATGRLAKCPACEATFTIDAETATTGAESAGEPAGTRPPPKVPQDSTPQDNPTSATASISTPASPKQSTNPFSSPLRSDTVSQATVNPYLPTRTADPDPVAEVGSLQIVPRSIEEILSPTLSIFGARLGFLLLAFVLSLIASLIVFGVPMIVMTALADTGSVMLAGIGVLLGIPLMTFFASYLSVGLARNAIAIARNSRSPMMELLPPIGVVSRFLVGVMAIALVVIVFGALFGTFMFVVASLGGNDGFAAVIGAAGILVSIVASMTACWLLWAWLFIVSDGKGTALGGIQAAYALTMSNKLTSVLLIVIATVLTIAGASSCYIGLLITQPLTNLMFAVGYLRMSHQEIDDPRLTRQSYEPPPPTPPTF